MRLKNLFKHWGSPEPARNVRASEEHLQRYRTEGFRSVEGWGVDSPLIEVFIHVDDFQRAHGVRGSLVEIGIHHGRTLLLLGLLRNEGERVVGIDLFEDAQEQNLDFSGSGSYVAFQDNAKRHAPGVDFTIVAGNSLALDAESVDAMNGCRLFHIDGGHYREIVSNDLLLAQTALGLGGVIVVDDYWHSGFPEVQEAVNRYFRTSSVLKAVPVMTGMNKLFLAHLSHKDRLLDYMAARMPPDRNKRVTVLGYPAICIDPH